MKKLLFSLLALSPLFAQNLTKIQDSENLTLTIYNNNLAMVNENRNFEINHSGKNQLLYEGIPSSVIFESIIPSFSQPTTLFSQNYRYDILSLNKLLEKHINKTVTYKEKISDYQFKQQQGKLLALNPIMIQKENEIISGVAPTDIIFSKVPEDLITRPSLVWSTTNQKGKQSIQLNYLTQNISWKSDYVLKLGESNSLNGWISIENNSGTSYKNAQIYCIAGNVKTAPVPLIKHRKVMQEMAYDSAVSPQIKQKAFAGYHLYSIPFKEDLRNKEKKQINFFNKKQLEVQSKATSSNNIYLHRFNTIKAQKFNHTLVLENDEDHGLGLPLPQGMVRVYKKDEGVSHFIGQDSISHTSKGESIQLHIGQFFDISQDISQEKFYRTKESVRSKYTRHIKNKTNKTQTIEVQENIYMNNIKTLSNKNNCKEQCQVQKNGRNQYQYTIQLQANKSFDLSVDYKAVYVEAKK